MTRPSQLAALVIISALVAAGLALLVPAMVRLAEPAFVAAFALPVLFVTSFGVYRLWRANVLSALGDTRTLEALQASYSPRRGVARVVLATAGMCFAVVALARPQWGEEPREVRREGIDVVVALDISRSMLATDVAPSRLEAAVDEVDRILRRLDGDRVGLVVFAGIAFVQSPLTSDYGAIRLYLDRLDPEDLPIQGTAIGRALHESTRLLVGDPTDDTYQRAPNQVIVVISDGEDHEGDPVAAAEAARAEGIDVYTVGVGTPEGGRIPVRGPDGQILRYFTDRQDNVVVTRLEEAQLTEVATRGGGQYIPLQAGGAVAQALDDAIDSYDAEALATLSRVEYEERFLVFLWPAFLLLLIGTGIRDRTVAAVLVVALFGATGCGDSLLRPDPRVQRALEASDAEQHDEALALLEEVGGEARATPTFPYAAGWVLERAAAQTPERWADAQAQYVRALNMETPEQQLAATFAIGNALLAREELDAAIARFQRVLVDDPSHDGARRNLEIALLRRYPPCTVSLDDEFEDDSDDAATAPMLPAPVYTGEFLPPGVQQTPGMQEEAPDLVVCGGDPDWYALPVVGGATVDVRASFTRLRDDNGGPPFSDEISPSSVRLTLYDIDGTTPIAVDQGLGDGDASPVDSRRLERVIEAAPIHPGLESGSIVYVAVEVDAPLEYELTIEIELEPPCYALEDEFESNDLRRTAHTLPSGEHQARLCESNDDWFRFPLQQADDLFVDVSPPVNDDGSVGAAEVTFQADAPDGTVVVEQFETGERAAYAMRAPQSAPGALLSLASREGTEGPYGVNVFHYPPCPAGRDRFEPNDDPNARADLQLQEAPFRYLRLCPQDVDWFTLNLPPATEEQQEESERRRFNALAELLPPPPVPVADNESEGSGEPVEVAADPRVELVVYDLQSSRLLAQSQPISIASPRAREGVDGDRGVVAYAELPWDVQQLVIGVRGDPTYYHLSFPQSQDQQQQQQQQEQQEQEQEEQEQEEQEQEEQEQEEQEQEQEEQEQEQEQQEPEPTEEEAEREELMELLDSLEPMDDNLPLRQALENVPPMNLRQQW